MFFPFLHTKKIKDHKILTQNSQRASGGPIIFTKCLLTPGGGGRAQQAQIFFSQP